MSRARVLRLYKDLLWSGRGYPAADLFRTNLKRAFLARKDISDPEKLNKAVELGEFVIKELQAMHSLNKYRAMKKRYYDEEEESQTLQNLLRHLSPANSAP
eukprot:gnl/Hemi2/20463_TR6791_c0_g1_i1.p1 gnl/Hemi2/20463_TR6791_c0_g1~~gnl/Hemi2/20463_TR6791_c0_g1_i1.p1  ORF type:complete len:101 (+),score=29.27 gnl/Hemi2/20463_TR6791_c0_g1_i1:236-538(+)